MEDCIMAQDAQWWLNSDLTGDIYSSMKSQEEKLVPFVGQSPQLHLRRYLVDWMAILCEKYEIDRHVLHLAVYMLDRFMDRYAIVQESQLHLLAFTCLQISTKFEEREEKVSKLSIYHAQSSVTSTNKEDYLQMELLLLQFFDWNITQPSATHFLGYFLTEAAAAASSSRNEVCRSWQGGCNEYSNIYMHKYTNYFLEISLQDHAFSFAKPSLVAASCIAASRVCLQLSPTWTASLTRITQYKWEHIATHIERMLRTHDVDEKAAKCQAKEKTSYGSQKTMSYNREAAVSHSGDYSRAI
ncbi:cyclin-J-like isoform X3 [Acanthaster planci]|uniref:Cyclin-J-like protein n=1 Tax=Acanthaster planci TaxID=133434 RepID=A0A8B7YMH2_ACAPL|nr:cyclin-J-like isoform X2 [Acanthaster planci]XP_022094459.1 cyclin-J-like isoform X3 [Acanthaster planci]